MGTKANIFHRIFWGRVGMERPNGDVDKNILGSEGSQREPILDW